MAAPGAASAAAAAGTPAARPAPEQVRRAIDVYLRHAYGEQPPPVNVRSLLAVLANWGGEFYECPIFAADVERPARRYTARLGNRHYPHMKLVIQLAPDGQQWLFRADSHDRHCCPPAGSPEHADFCRLMEQNQQVVEAVEGAWAEAGLPTFKTYLRDDLARRKAEG